jgi:hypothetical protein
LKAAGQPNGGADGSLLADPTEVMRPENHGLETIVGLLQPLPAQFNVSHGDVLQVSTLIRDLVLHVFTVHRLFSSLVFSVS